MRSIVDIYSADFFAEDPFGECFSPGETFEPLCLELYTVEEDVGHMNTFMTESPIGLMTSSTLLADPSLPAVIAGSDAEPHGNLQHVKETPEAAPLDKSIPCVSRQEADSETQTTCRSTDYDSVPNVASTRSSSVDQDQQPPCRNAEDERQRECQSAKCFLQRLTLVQQEEQIRFLRSKLQQYADLCAQYNIGQDLFPQKTEAVPIKPTIEECTAWTNYEVRTYADLMGPWDIPFHVEVTQEEAADNSDDYSGITFAQHPSKTRDSAPTLRRCPTDDDDTLPVIRPYFNRSKWTQRSSQQKKGPDLIANKRTPSIHSTTSEVGSRLEKFSSDLSGSKESRQKQRIGEGPGNIKKILRQPSLGEMQQFGSNKEQRITPREKEDIEGRVKRMSVFIERKYGRQRALYSGTIHSVSGCPHGMGILRYVKSGDIYIGEIAYGEMHGFGAYCHRKTNRLFRGTFHRNSFVEKAKQNDMTAVCSLCVDTDLLQDMQIS